MKFLFYFSIGWMVWMALQTFFQWFKRFMENEHCPICGTEMELSLYKHNGADVYICPRTGCKGDNIQRLDRLHDKINKK